MEKCISLGIPVTHGDPRPHGRLIVVASYQDLRASKGRPVVFLEHGAGQRYLGIDHPSYSGGPDRERVVLFLCPNDDVAQANLRRYPDSRALVIGSPKLDNLPRPNRSGPVAISFHADLHLVPETHWAFEHYLEILSELPKHFDVMGHCHPRMWPMAERFYNKAGIEPVKEFSEIVSRASIYCIDNSSTGPEAMAAGIPVIWLNAPWFRRDVTHGGRFWEWTRGFPVVDEPGQLVGTIRGVLDDWAYQSWRARIFAEAIFTALDGKASERAVLGLRSLSLSHIMASSGQ